MVATRKVVCTSCGATNFGVQEACMICNAALPDVAVADAAPGTPTQAIERLCTHCGARIGEGVRFCVECGTPVEATPPAPPATPVCSNCRAALSPGARFCVNCGTPVTA